MSCTPRYRYCIPYRRSYENADGPTAAHLGIEEGKPVAVIERVALGYDRQPIEYRLSRGAADTFRYQIDIS